MDVSVKVDTSIYKNSSAKLKRQLPYAGAVAVNNVSVLIRGEERSAMGRVFVKPTRFTLNSVLVERATKRSGVSKIHIRDEATKGTAPEKYLAPAVFGTARNEKRFERALHAAGLLPSGWYVVPGEAARLNKHGNITATTYSKILSQVRANPDPMQNATNSKRSKAKRGITKGYFVGKIEGTLGVWQRVGYKRRRSARPILIFVEGRPNYRKRFPFYQIAEGIARRHLPIELDKALSHAIATAKP
ncbi:hypothetical protein ACJJIC_15835 [Microbulbifer sp. ANSA002]|uniref:hypothetical protein n=1 Tax=unclassified Microbulbifer TaxID=2619833 RepID=UPI00404107F6